MFSAPPANRVVARGQRAAAVIQGSGVDRQPAGVQARVRSRDRQDAVAVLRQGEHPAAAAAVAQRAAERVVRGVIDRQRAVAHPRFRFRILDGAGAAKTGDRHAVTVNLQRRVAGTGHRHHGRAQKLIRVLRDDRAAVGDCEIAGNGGSRSLRQHQPDAGDRSGAGIRVAAVAREGQRAIALESKRPRAGNRRRVGKIAAVRTEHAAAGAQRDQTIESDVGRAGVQQPAAVENKARAGADAAIDPCGRQVVGAQDAAVDGDAAAEIVDGVEGQRAAAALDQRGACSR